MSNKVKLNALFEIEYGTKFDLNKMCQTTADDPDGISFASRSRENLGVAAYVKPYKNTPPLKAGLITVALGGTYLLSAFVQERPFYTAQNVAVLTPKENMSFTQKLFYCLCLRRNRPRYSAFGREVNRTLGLIEVPENMPDTFHEVQLEKAGPSPDAILATAVKSDSVGWKAFQLAELFDITGTKTTPVSELELHGLGHYPYVTTRATNNGISGFYGHATEKGGVLVVDSAVVGYCSYQRDDFSASDHVEKLIPKFAMNQYLGMFLATVINHNQYRFSYGRKASQKRLRKTWIKLPATAEGKPDWQFMDDFIKSLPYSRGLILEQSNGHPAPTPPTPHT